MDQSINQSIETVENGSINQSIYWDCWKWINQSINQRNGAWLRKILTDGLERCAPAQSRRRTLSCSRYNCGTDSNTSESRHPIPSSASSPPGEMPTCVLRQNGYGVCTWWTKSFSYPHPESRTSVETKPEQRASGHFSQHFFKKIKEIPIILRHSHWRSPCHCWRSTRPALPVEMSHPCRIRRPQETTMSPHHHHRQRHRMRNLKQTVTMTWDRWFLHPVSNCSACPKMEKTKPICTKTA